MKRSTEFKVVSKYEPTGDQPQAINSLSKEIIAKDASKQVLLGVTGSGKTFTIAKVIEEVNKHKTLPVLVLSHNKTLAAQLYQEFRDYFPDSAVEYFVSYYDFFQPEAYIAAKDLFIEKETKINDELDRLRNSTTRSLLERKNVIVVASVSCIYGLGSPEFYQELGVLIEKNADFPREELLTRLTDMQYERNDIALERGKFRAKGDIIEIWPGYEDFKITRIELFGDTVDAIKILHAVDRKVLEEIEDSTFIYPAKHYVLPDDILREGIDEIKILLEERVEELEKAGKIVEAHRLRQRTEFDIEMLQTVGFCTGIENYSVHFDNRKPGVYTPDAAEVYKFSSPPNTLIDYYKGNYLMIIDESHVTLPQVRGMIKGDISRKKSLVEHGFRLPTAFD
ncbi:MAG: DEAD/DEAH box helicase family protein, partial [Candidatus Hodarchaeales archaeon]